MYRYRIFHEAIWDVINQHLDKPCCIAMLLCFCIASMWKVPCNCKCIMQRWDCKKLLILLEYIEDNVMSLSHYSNLNWAIARSRFLYSDQHPFLLLSRKNLTEGVIGYHVGKTCGHESSSTILKFWNTRHCWIYL